MLPPVLLDAEVQADLVRACTRTAGQEFVGLLTGARTAAHWHVTRVVPMPNQSSRNDRFVVDAIAFARAEAKMRAGGLECLGFVHSHPHGSPALSTSDREQLWRGCLQLIVGGGPATGELRAYVGDAAGWHALRLHQPTTVRTP